MCDFVVLSVVEVCADYLNLGVVYGVGVCVVVCVVVCCLFLMYWYCLLCCVVV